MSKNQEVFMPYKPVHIYNSLTRQKELFEPINEGHIGLYLCGPTVYGDPHLGHARAAVTFDVVIRYFKYLGYKVRFVRNITDVGHLEQDADEGEDKIAVKARLEQLEPMEIVQTYTLSYHRAMAKLNNLPPSIEPTATGHISEQIALIEKILKNGLAYEVNGSVYFDLGAYRKGHNYGELSGKVLEELIAGTRDTEGQDEKRSPFDFALWKKATPTHIMHWPSPWGEGFPGWHIECTAMSGKYLGVPFDIHGGGMDLKFPHHEAEIAQCVGAHGKNPVRYWMHNNMLTINGKKMGKSLGNFITLEELFEGGHQVLERAFSPMTARFFMLQAHYRSELDFSNDALAAAEKGYKKLMNAVKTAKKLKYQGSGKGNTELSKVLDALINQAYLEMGDDFNTAKLLAVLFEMSSKINAFHDQKLALADISKNEWETFKDTFVGFVTDVLGLKPENQTQNKLQDELIQLFISMRTEARKKKDFATSDLIRDRLLALGVQLNDGADGTGFTIL